MTPPNDPNPEKELALRILRNTNTHLFLTGKAGTGKTTFLHSLRSQLRKRMAVVAPTGIAAINAGGVTIHSFFQLSFSMFIPGMKRENAFQIRKEKAQMIRSLELLIIDEVSMVRADLLDAIDEVMRRYRNRHLPFGGVQLLMIGDLHQLAPVVTTEERPLLLEHYETEFFFSSHALRQCRWVSVELLKVYRQRDEAFVALLNAVRNNSLSPAQLELLNARYRPDADQDFEGYIRLVTRNEQADQLNQQKLEALPGPSSLFDAHIEGTFPPSAYPMSSCVELRVGARVMFTKNDASPEKRYVNGSLGFVETINNQKVSVRLDDTQQSINVEPTVWQNIRYKLNAETKEMEEIIEGTFKQIPLRLAWAITVHKSQGLTFEQAVIDLNNAFAHGQAYVALSRCKSLEGMILSSPLSQHDLIQSGLISHFHQSIPEKIPQEQELQQMEHDFVLQCLDELFLFREVSEQLQRVMRVLLEFFEKKNPDQVTNFKILDRAFLEEVSEVSPKFARQYRQLLAAHPLSHNDALQDRLRKAAAYFGEKLLPLQHALRATQLAEGNKEASERYDRTSQALSDTLTEKRYLLDRVADQGFDLERYSQWRIAVAVGKTEAEKPRGGSSPKPTKAPQKARIPTYELSISLFLEGRSIAEIAQLRNLKTPTIYSHLSQGVGDGRIALEKLVSEKNILKTLAYLGQHPDETKLSVLYDALGSQVSYGELRLVLDAWHRQKAGAEND